MTRTRGWSFWKVAAALTVVVFVAYYAGPRRAGAQGNVCPPVLSSGMVSLLPGDVAVLSAVNAQPPACPGEPIRLRLMILNAQGQVLKQTSANVPANQALELDISYSEIFPAPGSPPPRASVRAVIATDPAPQNQAELKRVEAQIQQLQAQFELLNSIQKMYNRTALEVINSIGR